MKKYYLFIVLRSLKNAFLGVPVFFFWLMYESTESMRTALLSYPDGAFQKMILMMYGFMFIVCVAYEFIKPLIAPIFHERIDAWFK